MPLCNWQWYRAANDNLIAGSGGTPRHLEYFSFIWGLWVSCCIGSGYWEQKVGREPHVHRHYFVLPLLGNVLDNHHAVP